MHPDGLAPPAGTYARRREAPETRRAWSRRAQNRHQGRHHMAEHDQLQHLEVGEGDRAVATADVTTSAGSGGTARVFLHSVAGHIAPGRRACLVDAVLDLPAVRHSAHLKAAFRLGDSESLRRIEERCENVTSQPAGWSALLDANLRPDGGARASLDSAPGEPAER